MENIKPIVAANRDYIIALRRHFHMYPEVGGQEFNTQQKIIAELTEIGLSPRTAAGTGVIAELRGALPGRTVAVRADIDALPTQDEIDKPYKSRHSGLCHACGHDAHTAMLLGLARVFAAIQPNLAGNVRFLFQPSEECFPGGAQAMIEDGAMDGVSAIIGAHVWQPLQAGLLGITYGPMMASPDAFSITIQGTGGHGSMPHQTVDPIFVGAQIAVALKTITGSSLDPLETAVLSLGSFKAGEVFNIIPDKAVLLGTVRTFLHEVRLTIFERIDKICKGICEASGASYTLDKIFGYPSIINDRRVTSFIAEAGREALGIDGVREVKPAMTGEDFSYYQQKAPGAFMFVGVGNPEKGIVYPHHHPKFDLDEEALIPGVEVMARTVVKLLAN